MVCAKFRGSKMKCDLELNDELMVALGHTLTTGKEHFYDLWSVDKYPLPNRVPDFCNDLGLLQKYIEKYEVSIKYYKKYVQVSVDGGIFCDIDKNVCRAVTQILIRKLKEKTNVSI